MTNRDRFLNVLNGKSVDRLPVTEWASWWDKTVTNWISEDPDCPREPQALFRYHNLDALHQYWLPVGDGLTPPPAYHGAPVINDPDEFKRWLPHIYNENNYIWFLEWLKQVKPIHEKGETTVWYTFPGFFWFPRTLFGIENHLFAFYDYPELMHEMNERLTVYYEKVIPLMYNVLTPEFMTFAEDMAYNHGSMISKELFDEFIAPYYKRLVPLLKERGTKIIVDSDGFCEPLIPWFKELGVDGMLPCERQAGVDINRIRNNYPDFILIGGFDKMVMDKGEEAIRNEFERILSVMRSGRYVPGVDHQTPPAVTLKDYRIYLRLFHEYALK